MNVRIGRRARREIERLDGQWRAVARHPDLLASEFLAWVGKLSSVPGIGSPWPTARRPGLRRIQMPKCEVHLYFEVVGDEVRILCAWWSRRGQTPSP